MTQRIDRSRIGDRRGITILLALLFIAALTAAGLGATSIVLTQLRTTAATDRGIRAFYVADIGLERALFTIFNNRLAGSSFTTTRNRVQQNLPTLGSSTALADTSATVDLSSSTGTQYSLVLPQLTKDHTTQINLEDPDVPLSGTNPPQYLQLRSPDLVDPTDPTLEVQWVYITRTSGSGSFRENATTRLIRTTSSTDVVQIDLLTGNVTSSGVVPNPAGLTQPLASLNDVAAWVVRFRALKGKVRDLTIVACYPTSCPANPTNNFPVQSDLLVQSRGRLGDTSVSLSADVPWHVPVGGLFDFVIFSEATLDKPGS